MDGAVSYACALFPLLDVGESLRKIEELPETVPCVTFACSKCWKVSVFSYSSHVRVCALAGTVPYPHGSSWYESVAICSGGYGTFTGKKP